MKGNSLNATTADGRKSTLTLYTDSDFLTEKASSSESEISSMRGELEFVQRALNLQTQRCQHLVSEYTKRLQRKEQKYQSEKLLRDDQLAKVLRALLIFEARLKQEQKFINFQLEEKEKIIRKQREHIKNLSSQLCTHCKHFCGNDNSGNLDQADSYNETTSNEYASSSSENYYDVSSKETLPIGPAQESVKGKSSEITEEIRVFDSEDQQGNENWYASASDPEDNDERDMYRNNPVLECMNQILMQNINDPNISPPKTPAMERRNQQLSVADGNALKKVQFCDKQVPDNNNKTLPLDYYETPIQKVPNFYETPQSIYSNDYEQILSQNGDSDGCLVKEPLMAAEKNVCVVRKSKISRIPPALPPKPANLKLKTLKIAAPPELQQQQQQQHEKQITSNGSVDSEPDYCTISELNLPTTANTKQLNVVAELNFHNNCANKPELDVADNHHVIIHSPKSHSTINSKDLNATRKSNDGNLKSPGKTFKLETPQTANAIIPKLPLVSEIIIPDDNTKKESAIRKVERTPTKLMHKPRKSIEIGSSVSSLIHTFNSKEILSEMQRITPYDSKASSKNLVKSRGKSEEAPKEENHSYEFDLSQNFEEFKLDDCEIEEIGQETEEHVLPDIVVATSAVKNVENSAKCSVPTLNYNNVFNLNEKLEKVRRMKNRNTADFESGSGFEHFLECTGLSSKSILTAAKNNCEPVVEKLKMTQGKSKSNLLLKMQTLNVKYCAEPYI